MASTDALALLLRFKRLTQEYFARGIAAHAAGAFELDAGQLAVVTRIHEQVTAQIAELVRVLGAAAPAAADPATYDFTASGSVGGAPFAGALGAEGGDPFTGATRTEYFKLAQLFGDFGARLAIGRIPELMGDPVAQPLVGRLVVTDGRHAAEIRLMRGGASRGPVSGSTTAYTLLVFPWVGTAFPGRMFDTPGPLGFAGTATDATTQAGVATLVYGVAPTGAAASTTPSDSEANQVQLNQASFLAEAFDEPITTEKALAFLDRFVRDPELTH